MPWVHTPPIADFEESVYPMKCGVLWTSSSTDVGLWFIMAIICFQSFKHCFMGFVIVMSSFVSNCVAYNGDNRPRPPGIPKDACWSLPASS